MNPQDLAFPDVKKIYQQRTRILFDGTAGKGKVAVAAATSQGTLTSDATAPSNGETVTIGENIYTFVTALSEAKAVGTLTSDATNVTDGDTVTIGSIVYRFKNTLARAYDVKIGADAATTLDNLKAAINASGTPGTEYFAGTLAHPTVTATTNTNTTQVVQAIALGTGGNLIPSTEASSHLAWGGAVLAGGVDPIPNQVLIGGSAAIALDNIKEAINDSGTEGTNYSTNTVQNPRVSATTNTNTTQLVVARDSGADSNGVVTTESSAHLAWGASTLAGGVDAANAIQLFKAPSDGFISLVGVCSEDLTGATATISAGLTGATAALLPVATATSLDNGMRYDKTGLIAATVAPSAIPFYPVKAGDIIYLTVATADVTDGTLDVFAFYSSFVDPPSSGGTAATVADGANVAEGSTTDAAVAAGAAGTISAKLRRVSADMGTLLTQTDGLEASATAIDANAGATTDAANTTGATGTISGKLRGLLSILADMWDSTNHLLKVSLATILSQATDSVLTYPRGSNSTPISASTLILTGAGKLTGIFVTAASATPTIKVWDNTSAAGTVLLETFTPVAGTMYPIPSSRVANGIYVTISGTVACTVFHDPTTT